MSEWGDKLLTESDNARLRAENDKLKHELELEKFRGAGEIEAYRRETSVAVKKAAQVKAENAKLRELVRDMFSYAFNREMELCNACVEADGEYADCAACDEYDGACGIARKRFEELYADRMAELGVEVDA